MTMIALLLFSSIILDNNINVVVEGKKTVNLESFKKGVRPIHTWFEVNDPVMGGVSIGTFTIREEDGVGIFSGEVKDVPRLSSPGFIAVRTRGGYYPDLSSCQSIRLMVRGTTPYTGYRVSFGVAHPSSTLTFERGFKASFNASMESRTVAEEFQYVYIPFDQFSNNWDPKTGDHIVSCSQNKTFCPDEAALQNLQRLEIMAEGVLGKIHLEVKSIDAIDCDDDVVDIMLENFMEQQKGEDAPWKDLDYVGKGISHGAKNNNNKAIILENGDIRIESFDNPQNDWFPLNDPVMGGQSVSKVEMGRNNKFGVFDGEVKDVPSLGAPGFIKMETRGGYFPDVSSCKALRLRIRMILPDKYEGWFVTFGTHHRADAQPYIRGYKAHFQPDGVGRQDVIIPFDQFSDNWDPLTGKVLVSCLEDPKYCADTATLRDMTIFSIMGEGVNGDLRLEIESIDAIQCSHNTDAKGRTFSFFANTFNNFVLWGAIVVGIFSLVMFTVIVEHRNRRYHNREGTGESIERLTVTM